MLSLLTNTAIQLLLLSALFGGGHLALRWCGLERLRPARSSSAPAAPAVPWEVVLAAGIVWWSVLLCLLATIGTYRPLPLRVLTALGAAGGAFWMFRRLHSSRRTGAVGTPEPPVGSGVPRLLRYGLGLTLALVSGSVAITCAALWLQANRPDVSWDANVYHLEIPKRLLEAGGWRPFEWNVFGNWPHAVQMLWGAALAWGRHEGARLLHWSFTVGTCLLAARWAPSTLPAIFRATLSAALLLCHPVVLFEARNAYIDLAHALLLLAAFWAVERCTVEDAPGGTDWLFGLLLAGLVGVKLNGFLGAGALLVLWMFTSRERGLRQFVASTLPPLLVGVGWLTRSWWSTGNPVYPLLYRWFGGPNWSLELSAQFAAWQRSMGPGRELTDWLLLPWRVLTEGGRGYAHFDGELSLLAVPTLALGLWACRRDPSARRALTLAALLFVGWALTSQQMRLLIPMLPLLVVAALRALGTPDDPGGERVGPPPTATLATTLVVAVLASFAVLQSSWIYVRQTPRLARDLVAGGVALRNAVVPGYAKWINDHLTPDATILLVGSNHGFFLHPEIMVDSSFEASQIRWQFRDCVDARSALDRADQLGATHLLWHPRAAHLGLPRGLTDLVSCARRSSSLVYEERDLVVAELAQLQCPPDPPESQGALEM